MNSAMMYAN